MMTRPHSTLHGMTLIELILVMGILAIVLTASSPLLSDFFRGRRTKEEARRLLALTRFGRSEAVSRAVAMELWINDREGLYGLRPWIDTGEDENALREYEVTDGLEIAFEPDVTNQDEEGVIVFQPDGTIDDESLEAIIVRELPRAGEVRRRNEEETEIEIVRSEVGVGFSILDPLREERSTNERRR